VVPVLGPYIVLELAVLNVHLEKLAETALREKLGKTDAAIPKWVRRFEDLAGEKNQAKLEAEIVPGIVASKMTAEMPKMMGKKLAEKGMVADVDVVSEKEQDDFFEQKLKEVRTLMETE
jgi:siroheme synthase